MKTMITVLSFLLLANLQIIANEVQPNYRQFENEYAEIFGEKPSCEVWNTKMETCGEGSGNCKSNCKGCKNG